MDNNTFIEELLKTWYLNHRTNLLLLENLEEAHLELTTAPRGGGKIGHQLAHMTNVRIWKLERFNKAWVKDIPTIRSADPKSLPLLRERHQLTADLTAGMFEEGVGPDGSIKGFKRGAIPLLGYFIHHEAHHRGNILLTLKNSGVKLSQELKYGLWEWNKI